MLDIGMIAIGAGFLSFPSSMCSPASECEAAMLLDYVLGSIVTIVIMVYLVHALINPERF